MQRAQQLRSRPFALGCCFKHRSFQSRRCQLHDPLPRQSPHLCFVFFVCERSASPARGVTSRTSEIRWRTQVRCLPQAPCEQPASSEVGTSSPWPRDTSAAMFMAGDILKIRMERVKGACSFDFQVFENERSYCNERPFSVILPQILSHFWSVLWLELHAT